jgi:hypothetical protein
LKFAFPDCKSQLRHGPTPRSTIRKETRHFAPGQSRVSGHCRWRSCR